MSPLFIYINWWTTFDFILPTIDAMSWENILLTVETWNQKPYFKHFFRIFAIKEFDLSTLFKYLKRNMIY